MKIQEFLAMPIDSLEQGFPKAGRNALLAFGIEKVGDLLQREPKDISRIKMFGRKAHRALCGRLLRFLLFEADDQSPEWKELAEWTYQFNSLK